MPEKKTSRLAGFTLSPEPVSKRAAGFTPGPEPVHERAAGFTLGPNQYAKEPPVSHLGQTSTRKSRWFHTWRYGLAHTLQPATRASSACCRVTQTPRAQDDAWHQKNPSSSSDDAAAALNLRNTLPKSEL